MRYGQNYHQDSRRQALIGTIMGLAKELAQLAPHPDCPGYKGPLFIKGNPHFKLADERDGMLGSMIMEGILGAAFAEAVSDMYESATQGLDLPHFDMPNIDVSNLLDCYDEYVNTMRSDKEKKHIAEHGQGTLARMSGKSLAKGFNMRAAISEGMQAFFEDLPTRMTLERNMAYYARELDMIEHIPAYRQTSKPAAPGMAA